MAASKFIHQQNPRPSENRTRPCQELGLVPGNATGPYQRMYSSLPPEPLVEVNRRKRPLRLFIRKPFVKPGDIVFYRILRIGFVCSI